MYYYNARALLKKADREGYVGLCAGFGLYTKKQAKKDLDPKYATKLSRASYWIISDDLTMTPVRWSNDESLVEMYTLQVAIENKISEDLENLLYEELRGNRHNFNRELCCAMENDFPFAVELMLRHCSFNVRDGLVLRTAIQNGYLDVVQKFMPWCDSDDWSLEELDEAALNGHVDMLVFLRGKYDTADLEVWCDEGALESINLAKRKLAEIKGKVIQVKRANLSNLYL